jgi:hypothetical protein
MGAGDSACSCAECGTICRGHFEGGCESVWARGLRHNAPARPVTVSSKPALALAGVNGTLPGSDSGAEVVVRVDGSGVETSRNSMAAHGGIGHPSENAGLAQRMTLVEIALTAVVGRVDRLVHM